MMTREEMLALKPGDWVWCARGPELRRLPIARQHDGGTEFEFASVNPSPERSDTCTCAAFRTEKGVSVNPMFSHLLLAVAPPPGGLFE